MVGLVGVLALRRELGVACLPAVVRVLGVDGGEMGDLVGGRLMEASRRFISGGIAMPWTMLTAVHSTIWIMSYSVGAGGRQHPGHPGLP